MIRALANHKRLSPGNAKRLADQLNELKDMRLQADYTMAPGNLQSSNIFSKYGVADWDGLANVAMAFASNLIPELQKLTSFEQA